MTTLVFQKSGRELSQPMRRHIHFQTHAPTHPAGSGQASCAVSGHHFLLDASSCCQTHTPAHRVPCSPELLLKSQQCLNSADAPAKLCEVANGRGQSDVRRHASEHRQRWSSHTFTIRLRARLDSSVPWAVRNERRRAHLGRRALN